MIQKSGLLELKKYNDKHRANDFIDGYAKGGKGQKERKTLFAWVLKEAVRTESKPYLGHSVLWGKTEN